MPEVKRNRLVNRASGLYAGGGHGAKTPEIPKELQAKTQGRINYISDGLKGLPIVPIASLVQDPMNAREHPERNLETIKQSLYLYGQLKPLVVRRESNVIIAGNGTHRAATELGWTEIAVNYTDMSEVEAAGFGLVDNRSAELAKWNFEIVARIDKLLQDEKHVTTGWTLDELEILRQADWTPPVITDEEFDIDKVLTVKFSGEQLGVIEKVIELMKSDEKMTDADCIVGICSLWLKESGYVPEASKAG